MSLPTENAPLVEGPPIEDISTMFDDALTCLKPKMNRGVPFGVGAVLDLTGRESYGEGGAGKYVSQGVGDMVQSALLRAGALVVNRRSMDVPINEVRWGIRKLDRQVPTTFFVTGSVNTLDFIPGGGFSAAVAGVGPRYRQNRIIVALDLFLTESSTGRIVASVPLQKQLFAAEYGVGVGRFFGSTLTVADIGVMEREALNLALRHMVSLATFELLSQVMSPKEYLPCRRQIDAAHGVLDSTPTAEVEKAVLASLEDLRQSDPRSAMILERELAGESIDDIMASLGDEPAAAEPAGLVPDDPQVAEPAPASEAPEPLSVPPEESYGDAPEPADPSPAEPSPPDIDPERERLELMRRRGVIGEALPVDIEERGRFTRVAVGAPFGADLRWGLRGGKLLVVAMGAYRGFDLEGTKGARGITRVAGMRAGGNASAQALEISLNCDCGVVGAIADDGRLTLDIAEGAPKPKLDLAAQPAAPAEAPSPTTATPSSSDGTADGTTDLEASEEEVLGVDEPQEERERREELRRRGTLGAVSDVGPDESVPTASPIPRSARFAHASATGRPPLFELQVAALRDGVRAAALRSWLADRGVPAVVQRREIGGGRALHVIFAGPFGGRDEIRPLIAMLRREHGVEPLLRNHDPTGPLSAPEGTTATETEADGENPATSGRIAA